MYPQKMQYIKQNTAFTNAFTDLHKVTKAITNLQHYKMWAGDLDKYISQFKSQVGKAQYDLDA